MPSAAINIARSLSSTLVASYKECGCPPKHGSSQYKMNMNMLSWVYMIKVLWLSCSANWRAEASQPSRKNYM